ncbi:MAG: class II SORL domain-containing protein [Anaerolineae bacterium]
MIAEHIQHADWKNEKHVPVIECPDTVPSGEMFSVSVTLGKEIAHPNTTEHHIRWITLYFMPEGAKFIYDVARLEFSAHGESVQGPNQGPVYTHHGGTISMRTTSPGTLYALAYCNIHGLWEGSHEIRLG